MNWASIKFDWNHARAFLATAEQGSLSAAAQVLGLTQPTLSRQVAALEEEIGVTLFERTGRSLTLTNAGVEILDHVKSMADAANRLSLTASGQSQTIEGLVRITASDLMSAHILPTAIKKLYNLAPLLEIDVIADNNLRDLMQREADIAVRHVRPKQPYLIAKLVKEDTARFYATGSYVDAHGRPTADCDFSDHQFISFVSSDRMLNYLEPLGLGLKRSNFRLGSQSGNVAWELARNGLGIALMSDEIASKFDEFEPVIPEVAPFTFPTWLVTHRELHTSRRIRLVFDFLADFYLDNLPASVHSH